MRQKTFWFLAPAAVLSLAGCTSATAPRTAPPPPAEAAITISVGPCFGFCPVYSVMVSSSGTISFEGERHTAALGKHQREGGAASYSALAAALAPFRPSQGTVARTTCEQQITDQPHYDISWTANDGTVTKLQHDRGCRSPKNDTLNAVLQDLPDQLGIEPWARQLTRPGVSRG
ncbi:DUF6438 domain-containing protein [Novosphingobium terrae]|uniref:DUF6438 domain-containing protein n=1 Tax=Novosphingobium terrae TaxID=2726189 RepID=UPI001F1295CB|nr:DUF6438 domain-containing protein [Novosphingobium terrae]